MLDPITNLVEPLHDFIFQHLSGQDVKNLFFMSKEWNAAAISSRKAMSKIRLNVGKGELPEDDLELLLESRRPYKHAEIRFGRRANCRKTLLLDKISTNLDEVGLSPDYRQNCPFPPHIKFPLLKKLTISFCMSAEVHQILSGTSEQLKELVLTAVYDSFDSPIPSIKGKLTSLDITCLEPWNEQQQQNFMKFLTPSSSTLQILRIIHCSPEVFEFILTKLPALKVLEVLEFDFEEVSGQIQNQNITTLVTQNEKFTSLDTLKCMENLVTIQTRHGDDVLEELLRQAKYAKKLKTIEVEWSVKSPHSIYREMMESDETIPRDIAIIHICNGEHCCRS